MSVERINSQLKKVREQIAQLQAKEKDLAEQKQMAEDAEGSCVPYAVGNAFLYADGGIFCQQDKHDRGSCGG